MAINPNSVEKLDNCLTLNLTKDKKEMRLSLTVGYISLLVDLEAARDLINVWYPMFIYRHLV